MLTGHVGEFFVLTIKEPITTAADNHLIFKKNKKTKKKKQRKCLDISCELSAKQKIHIKCQLIFFSEK